jgi:hypothetical protein
MYDDIDDTQFVHLPNRISAQLDRELSEEDEVSEIFELLMEQDELQEELDYE